MTFRQITGRRFNQYTKDYVVFDLETTGVNPKEDSIIEISAIKVRDHKPVEEFTTLINPGTHIPAGASHVNGITDDMVKDAPSLEDVLPGFLDFIKGEILVGHNIQSFDLLFIYKAAEELLQQDVPNDYVDTLYMARERLSMLRRHRLVDISSYFNVSIEGAHRAFNDCMMNHHCYEKMGEMVQDTKVEICPNCGGQLKRRSGRYGDFYGCTNFPGCRFTKNG